VKKIIAEIPFSQEDFGLATKIVFLQLDKESLFFLLLGAQLQNLRVGLVQHDRAR
jgi:hypothetical protein